MSAGALDLTMTLPVAVTRAPSAKGLHKHECNLPEVKFKLKGTTNWTGLATALTVKLILTAVRLTCYIIQN